MTHATSHRVAVDGKMESENTNKKAHKSGLDMSVLKQII
jgi:hypothetical protein